MLKDNEITDYVKEGVLSILGKIPFEKLIEFDPEISSIRISFPIYTIPFQGNTIFIPTGTPEAPKGLAPFSGKFVVISDQKDNHFFLTRQQLVKLIKDNKGEGGVFERGIGPDFETMGFSISVDNLKKISE